MRQAVVSVVSGHPLQVAGPQVTDADFSTIIDHWSDRISRILPDKPDLIVLPELFDRPVVSSQPAAEHLRPEHRAEFARSKGNRVQAGLAEIAVAHRTYITVPSYRIADDGTIRNSIQFLGRDGEVAATYDKMVPTPAEIADVGVQPGSAVLAADFDFGRVSAAICFDLNFEQVRAGVAAVKPDLIVFPSAYHGGLMQNYWALSCRSYFVGCVSPPNRSTIINPTGHEVASTSTYDWLITRTLNLDYALAHLDRNREKLLRLKAEYGRGVLIEDPGLVGMVLVSSLTDGVTADEMLAQFEIGDLDSYFAESTAHLDPSGRLA
ncbi:carbon-nitrogen hydrolase family protein [Propionibacteriaceae bacterium Y1700]|uniref:carbon-nitrogen hydrolase family protein n=1 Tax=Microlunatus sp. Y1700 TaxID=3418487 RepID=UPI003DA77377